MPEKTNKNARAGHSPGISVAKVFIRIGYVTQIDILIDKETKKVCFQNDLTIL